MIVSSPPVISESWVSSVMIGDRDVSGRQYTGNFFVLFMALGGRISDDAYRIDLGLSQISGILGFLLDVGYGVFQNLSGNS